MVQVASLRRRSWVGVAWVLVISAGLLIALALGSTIVLLATLALAALVGLLLRGSEPAPTSSPLRSAAVVAEAPRVQRRVVAADGAARQALVVPVPAAEGYQAVLTIDGYALVNDEGRVVYALNRGLHAPMSEPVVVTILDTDFDTEVAAR
jgi:hypothetical protein